MRNEQPLPLLSASWHGHPAAELSALRETARGLREEFATTAGRVDALALDTADNLRRIQSVGLNRLHVSREYGGLSTGALNFAFSAFLDILADISAGETSTAQNWGMSALVMRTLFAPHVDLPDSTRSQLAHETLHEDVRLVASDAEAGHSSFTTGVTARKLSGGVAVNGTKVFNSNSGGGGYASVSCVLIDGDARSPHQLVTRLSAPGVRRWHDWDNMGQRGTFSQTIDYDEVFVPDGWHYPRRVPLPLAAAMLWTVHGALTLGAGVAALDGAIEYLHSVRRTITPGAGAAARDPLITLRVGAHSTELAAARALLRQAARRIEGCDASAGSADAAPVLIDALRARAACHRAALSVSSELFELTGARSTANAYRLDRFWRNVRTLTVHDPTDVKLQWIGGWEIGAEIPPIPA